MRSKGFVYTLIVMTLVLVVISLVSYYVIVSQPVIGDAINKMRTDELYYFVESVKMDHSRSVSIAGQRSFVYLIDYSIKNNATFDNYEMRNCTNFKYKANGSQAAAVELMLCGTLYGNPLLLADFMENHTLLKWAQRISGKGNELNFIVDVKPGEIEIIPYDSWNFYIISKLDLTVQDKLNQSFYKGYDIPVVSKISIDTMEDPVYSVKTGSYDLLRYFTPCNPSALVNATTVGMWLESECYQQNANAPSFFDRLDGKMNKSEKYVKQSEKVKELGLAQQAIGLESFVDLDKFTSYNVSVGYNLSWVDYYYWNNIPAYCSVINLDHHENFKIDFDHAVAYSIRGLNCSILAGDSFMPPALMFPVNTTVTWINTNPADSCNLAVNANGWHAKELIPTEQFSWVFNETGTYRMNCTLFPSGVSFSGTIVVK